MDMDDANLLAAASVTDLSQLPAGYRQTFTKAVETTLVEVFGESTKNAREKVESYFAPGEGGPSLFTFHSSPLQVAADLFSPENRALRDDELARYIAIQDSWVRSLGLLDEAGPSDRSASDNASNQRGGIKKRSGAA